MRCVAQKEKQKAARDRQRQKNEKKQAKRDEKAEAEVLKQEGNDAFRDGKMEEVRGVLLAAVFTVYV